LFRSEKPSQAGSSPPRTWLTESWSPYRDIEQRPAAALGHTAYDDFKQALTTVVASLTQATPDRQP
jgi:hypothetical protein